MMKLRSPLSALLVLFAALAACSSPPSDPGSSGPPEAATPARNLLTHSDLPNTLDGVCLTPGAVTYSFEPLVPLAQLPDWTETLLSVDGTRQAGPTPRTAMGADLEGGRIFMDLDIADAIPTDSLSDPTDDGSPEQVGELILRLQFSPDPASRLEATIALWHCPPPLPASKFVFESSWTLDGAPVICENRSTTFSYTFHTELPDSLTRITERWTGPQSGETYLHTISVPDSGVVIAADGSVSVEPRIIEPDWAPLGIGRAAIVVTPRPPAGEPLLAGETTLQVEIHTDAGTYSFQTIILPVIANCS